MNGGVDLGVMNVHLMSGEDIIGRAFHDVAGKNWRVEMPTMPTMSQDPQSGHYQVGLLPLRPYLKDKVPHVDIPDTSVAYAVEVGQQMSDLWTKATSNIQIAGPGSLSQLLKG